MSRDFENSSWDPCGRVAKLQFVLRRKFNTVTRSARVMDGNAWDLPGTGNLIPAAQFRSVADFG
jgi:hypothetical protein